MANLLTGCLLDFRQSQAIFLVYTNCRLSVVRGKSGMEGDPDKPGRCKGYFTSTRVNLKFIPPTV